MTATVIPLFVAPPDEVALTYTAVLRGIAEAIEQRCGTDPDDQMADLGSSMFIGIDLTTGRIDVEMSGGSVVP